jgi:hypothetical protein
LRLRDGPRFVRWQPVSGGSANANGHFDQARRHRGPKALGAKVNVMAAIGIGRMHNDGLQDTVLPNVVSEFSQLRFGEFSAGVVGIFEQKAHWKHPWRNGRIWRFGQGNFERQIKPRRSGL